MGEHALRTQPGVTDAVVLLLSELDKLVAYVTPASVESEDDAVGCGARFEAAACLSGMRGSLPSHMVPSLAIGIDAWPRTSSGKIDRRQLSRLETNHPRSNLVVAPRTLPETVVREAFAAMLQLKAEA